MRRWKLQIAHKNLAFVAPHGTFYALGMEPHVREIIDRLPEGTVLECECEGKVVDKLHVRKITKLLRRGGTAPDVALALELDDDDVLADYEQLTPELRAEYMPRLAVWQAKQPASWRALRFLPLARWTTEHLTEAIEEIADGGNFGTADADAILAELAKRGVTLEDAAAKLATLKSARTTQGDTQFRVTTELFEPRVVGATADGLVLAGDEDERAMVVLVGRDGVERRRWPDVEAQDVIGDVRLTDKRAFRLSDGELLYEYPYARGRFDHELIYCVLDKRWADRTMHSELRRLTGELVIRFDTWIDDLWWDGEYVYTRVGEDTIAYHRDGRLAPGVKPPPVRDLRVETANGVITYPHDAPPWAFGMWNHFEGGGWAGYRQHERRPMLIAPTEPGATWTGLSLVGDLREPRLAPPWMTFRYGNTFLAIALAELVTASQIVVDGELVIERIAGNTAPSPAPELVAWYEAIASTGVIPRLGEAERDRMLLQRIEGGAVTPAALRNVCYGTPSYVEHGEELGPDDAFLPALGRILALEGIAVAEIAREKSYIDQISLQVRRGDHVLEEAPMEAVGSDVAYTLDSMLARMGSSRRIYALVTETGNSGYLVVTPAQRAALIAAGIAGLL